MILQPNGWSCVPAAFSMASGINVEDLIRATGHDGSALREDGTRQGFSEHEMVDVLYVKGYAAICVWPDTHERVGKWLSTHSCVLLGMVDGKNHAVFWNHNDSLIFDPVGYKYGVEKFTIERLYIIKSF